MQCLGIVFDKEKSTSAQSPLLNNPTCMGLSQQMLKVAVGVISMAFILWFVVGGSGIKASASVIT